MSLNADIRQNVKPVLAFFDWKSSKRMMKNDVFCEAFPLFVRQTGDWDLDADVKPKIIEKFEFKS